MEILVREIDPEKYNIALFALNQGRPGSTADISADALGVPLRVENVRAILTPNLDSQTQAVIGKLTALHLKALSYCARMAETPKGSWWALQRALMVFPLVTNLQTEGCLDNFSRLKVAEARMLQAVSPLFNKDQRLDLLEQAYMTLSAENISSLAIGETWNIERRLMEAELEGACYGRLQGYKKVLEVVNSRARYSEGCDPVDLLSSSFLMMESVQRVGIPGVELGGEEVKKLIVAYPHLEHLAMIWMNGWMVTNGHKSSLRERVARGWKDLNSCGRKRLHQILMDQLYCEPVAKIGKR